MVPPGPVELGIVQPYVPEYRVPFFDALVARLAADGVRCTILAGRPAGDQAARGDAAPQQPWMRELTDHTLRIAGKGLVVTDAAAATRAMDAVIVGLVGTNLDTYAALVRRLVKRTPVGLWGHVRSYVGPPNRIDRRLEQLQMRCADQVFAYTPSGAAFAVEQGVRPDRVTAVMNTVDMTPVLQLRSAPETRLDAESLARRHGLVPGRTAVFIGGLDPSKRIDFLAQVLDRLWSVEPAFRLLVLGRGSQEGLLRAAQERGQAVLLGFGGPSHKAVAGLLAGAVAMPGRVGLVAVEALALGLPIVTTDFAYHAPEFEYLRPGESLISTPENDVGAYADALLRAAALPRGRFDHPTMDTMVDNFHAGVLRMISAKSGAPTIG
jgi:glycosyltransferase involved in cell wall biosynthesis